MDKIYSFKDADLAEIVVYSDRLIINFKNDFKIVILKNDLVGVGHIITNDYCLPDYIVVLFRNEDGNLEDLVYPLVSENVAKTVSDNIFKIIDHRFAKAFIYFFYMMFKFDKKQL